MIRKIRIRRVVPVRRCEVCGRRNTLILRWEDTGWPKHRDIYACWRPWHWKWSRP